jgi:hypothetical protein
MEPAHAGTVQNPRALTRKPLSRRTWRSGGSPLAVAAQLEPTPPVVRNKHARLNCPKVPETLRFGQLVAVKGWILAERSTAGRSPGTEHQPGVLQLDFERPA